MTTSISLARMAGASLSYPNNALGIVDRVPDAAASGDLVLPCSNLEPSISTWLRAHLS
ncbi:hypothetical protein [Nocardia sp. NPDC046763]|uniref:hypothetical protein n=1 Tax=Nocardia sp. NPDC046763 TaxID=3155256 RepID=UPI0033E33609